MTTKHFCLFLIKEFEENALLTVHILPKHKGGGRGIGNDYFDFVMIDFDYFD